MKKLAVLLFALLPLLAVAQTTPEAIIGDAPALPTPQEWAANGGHTEAFRYKIKDLNAKLSKIVSTPALNITATDFEEVKAQQMKEVEMMPKRLEQAAKGMEMMQMLMSKMNLTEDDIEKLSNMSDKESEAFIMKRMQESGLNPDDIAAMAADMGLDTRPPADTPKVDPQAIIASQEATQAFMEKMQLYQSKAREWETGADRRIKAEYEKYKKSLPENLYGADDVFTGSITLDQFNAQQAHLNQLKDAYKAAAYRIWTEVIHNCQGELKILMQYASAADAAKAKMPNTSGNAAFDVLGKASYNAATIAGQYLRVTESEPKIDY